MLMISLVLLALMLLFNVGMNSSARSYLAALTAPFSDDAMGAQVPDLYSFPTSTEYVKTEFTVYTQDSSGNCDFAVLPHIYQSFYASNASASVMGGVSIPDFTTVPSLSPLNPLTGCALAGVVTPAVLSSSFSQYRIVGFGARVRPLLAPLNQQGRLILASVPSGGTAFPLGVFGSAYEAVLNNAPSVTPNANLLPWLGLPSVDGSGYLSTNMLNIPDAQEYAYSELGLKGGLEWVSKSTGPSTLDFLPALNLTGLNTMSSASPVLPGGVGVSLPCENVNFGSVGTMCIESCNCVLVSCNATSYQINIICNSVQNLGGVMTSVPAVGDFLAVTPPGINMFNPLLPLPIVMACVSSSVVSGTEWNYTLTLSCPVNQTVSTAAAGLIFMRTIIVPPRSVVNLGGATGTTSTGVSCVAASSAVDPSYLSTAGWSQLCCRATGLPNTGGLAVFSVEVVYHLEGIPNVPTSGGFATSGHVPPTNGMFMAASLEAAASLPHFRRLQENSNSVLAQLAIAN
jgi:hypothetical protein